MTSGSPVNNVESSGYKAERFTPIALLLAILVSGISTFMIYPLLTLQLLEYGLDFGKIGLILGVLSGTGRLASVVLGAINNKVGSKLTTCLGLVLRTVGISVFLFQTEIGIYLVFSALASLGSSATALGIKSELMRFSATRKYITLRSMAINSGAIIGPALGAGLYYVLNFNVILLVSVVAYLVLAITLSFLKFSPPESKAIDTQQDSDCNAGNSRRNFLAILSIAGLYWVVYSQWSIVVPVQAVSVFGSKEASNGIYIANAVIVLLFQYPLLVVLLKSVKDKTILLLGFTCFLPAFLTLFFNPGMFQVMIFCIAFSLGELFVSPTIDSQTAKLAPRSIGITRAYGIQDTVTGLCSIGGSAVGGILIAHFENIMGASFLCLPAALAAIVLSLLIKNVEVHQK